MRRGLWIGLTLILLAGLLAWGSIPPSTLPSVPDGDQEIAWIQPATNAAAWERFITGAHRAAHENPRLKVDDRRAFLDQSTQIPEVVISAEGIEGRLRIRWYKLTSDTNSAHWVRELSSRDPAPLAFIGGTTSDRALELAQALKAQAKWRGERPLLLIPTATANSVQLDPFSQPMPGDAEATRLINVYKERSFRFCFTNQQIANAVVDFLWSQPDLRPIRDPLHSLAALGSSIAPWAVIGTIASQAAAPPPIVTAIEWNDDPYSIDLSRQFHEAFHRSGRPQVLVRDTRGIFFSVGGAFRPNRWESEAADLLVNDLRSAGLDRQVLVLAAGPAQARRILRAVVTSLPLAGRNLVAVTGDSISFNNLYRDGDIAWNVRSLPVPLVMFTHQNPIAWDSKPTDEDPASDSRWAGLLPPSGTDDVLIYRDILRLFAEAAMAEDGRLTASADEIAIRLHQLTPAYFDRAGDRIGGRGEHIGVVRPRFVALGTPVLAAAMLEIWTRTDSEWQLLDRLTLDHGRTNTNP